jgi:hypothetical protein
VRFRRVVNFDLAVMADSTAPALDPQADASSDDEVETTNGAPATNGASMSVRLGGMESALRLVTRANFP